jgi:hypothetical protein
MGYPTPKINSNGEGIWDTGSTSDGTFGNPATGSQNVLAQAGSNQSRPGGNAATPDQGPNLSGADQLSGAINKPTPNQSLLSTVTNQSANQLTGNGSAPSPDQSLLGTKQGAPAPVRKSCLGGVEKGVQIP